MKILINHSERGTGPYSSSFISSVTFASSSLSASGSVAFALVALPSVPLTSVAFVAFASMTTGFFFALRRAARTTVGLSFAFSSATRKAGSSWFLSFFWAFSWSSSHAPACVEIS